jgi:hypothetical protein
MATLKENVNGWDIIDQILYQSDEGYTASAYGAKPMGYGTNWKIVRTGMFCKMNRHTGEVFGKTMGGAFESVKEAEDFCMKFGASTISVGS